MTDNTKKPNRGLLYVIVLCFIGLLATGYFLATSIQEIRELNSHKKVLIRRLAEEVTAKKFLQEELDSLKKQVENQDPMPLSEDLQPVVQP